MKRTNMKTMTMKPMNFFLAALLAALSTAAQSQEPGKMPDQPVSQEQLAPGAYAAFTAPLQAEVTLDALNARPSPPISWGAAFNHYYHSNVMNHEHGGFEPMALRPKYRAEATAFDSVELSEKLAQNVREGLYDGARVRVYQAIDGKAELIRDTKVKPGGHHATGWMDTRGQLTTTKDKTSFKLALDGSFLPDRDYWFCVKAVDDFYQFSEPSNAVSARSGAEAKGQTNPEPYPGFQQFDAQNPDKPAPPPAPKNLRVTQEGDILAFTWDPVEAGRLRGYKLFVSSVPPDKQKGYRLNLADRQPRPDRPIQRGDIVFVDHPGLTTWRQEDLSPYVNWPALRQIRQPFNSWMLGNYRFWSDGSDYPAKWELVPHPEPVPKDFIARGKTCLKWEVADDKLTGFMLGATGGLDRKNNWYTPLVPGEYVVEVWARGSGKAQIAFSGIHANPGTPLPFNQPVPADNPHAIAPVELPLSEQWQKITGTFTVRSIPEVGLGHILFTFQGPGTLWLDDLRIYRKDTVPYGVFNEPYLSHLRDTGARFLRFHELIRTKLGYTLAENLLPAGGSAISFNGFRSKPSTLQSQLETTRLAGQSPRLQIEMCLSEDEWLGLAEWLFAPYDPAKGDTPEKKPWAYLRWAMGQQKPWIDEFPEMAIELSNETWNETFEPYDWDWGRHVMVDGRDGRTYSYGATYGLFQQHVIETIKSSPYWNEQVADKLSFPICGWSAALSFGADAARHSPDSKAVGYANYLGTDGLGDPRTMTDFKRFYMMQWALSSVEDRSRKVIDLEKQLRAEGADSESEIYEYGILYTAPAPPEVTEAENQFGRAIPAAVASLDASLKALSFGFQNLNYFTFAPQLGAWGSNTEERFGGHLYPFAKALSLFNNHGTGHLLKVDFASAPAWDFPEYVALDNTTRVKRSALPKAPLVSVYASASGDRVTLFLISRKLDNFPVLGDEGFTPATVTLPFAKAKKITLLKLAGDPRVDDRFEEHAKVETIAIDPKAFSRTLKVDASTGADARGLPPASIFCYVFEGTDMPKPGLPPVARFKLPEPILAGEPARLEAATAADLSYEWDAGIAGKSEGPVATVTFPETTMATIALKATDKAGRSDTIAHKRYPVGIRFGEEIWRPWFMEDWKKGGGARARTVDGRLLVSGAHPIIARGQFSLLRGEPAFQKDIAMEATIEAIEGPTGDPRTLAGLVLASNKRTGLGFGELDFEALDTHAALLISPDGAVRKLRGAGDQVEELLPAGSVSFPVKARIVTAGRKATAAIFQDGAWKELAAFDLPGDIGIMPGLAVGSPNQGETKMSISSLSVLR